MTASGKELWFPWHAGMSLQTCIDEVSMGKTGLDFCSDFGAGPTMIQQQISGGDVRTFYMMGMVRPSISIGLMGAQGRNTPVQ